MLTDQDQEQSQPVSTGFEELGGSQPAAPEPSPPVAEATQTASTSEPSVEDAGGIPNNEIEVHDKGIVTGLVDPESAPVSAGGIATGRIAAGDDPGYVPVSTELINLVEPSEPPTSEAARQNKEWFDKVMAARNAPPAVVPKQPPIPHILEQTKREMAEGARQSERHRKAQEIIPPRKAAPKEVAAQGTTVPVFRPTDGAGSKDRKAL